MLTRSSVPIYVTAPGTFDFGMLSAYDADLLEDMVGKRHAPDLMVRAEDSAVLYRWNLLAPTADLSVVLDIMTGDEPLPWLRTNHCHTYSMVLAGSYRELIAKWPHLHLLPDTFVRLKGDSFFKECNWAHRAIMHDSPYAMLVQVFGSKKAEPGFWIRQKKRAFAEVTEALPMGAILLREKIHT